MEKALKHIENEKDNIINELKLLKDLHSSSNINGYFKESIDAQMSEKRRYLRTIHIFERYIENEKEIQEHKDENYFLKNLL